MRRRDAGRHRLRGASPARVLHVVHGLVMCCSALSRASMLDERMRRVQWWSAKLLRLLGIALEAEGTLRPGAEVASGQSHFVARHRGHQRRRAVALRVQVRSRAIGRSSAGWSTAAGTLYIERERRRDAMRVVHQMAEALKAGDTRRDLSRRHDDRRAQLVAVPCESAAGRHCHAVAGATGRPALQRSRRAACQPGGRPTSATRRWCNRVLMVVTAEQLTAHVHLLAAEPTERVDRRRVSQLARESIAARLNADCSP